MGVLAGSHYNRGWTVHNKFSEALERLLFKRLVYEEEPTIPDRFHDLANINKENLESLLDDESIPFTQTYQRYRSRIRNRAAGKTAQFWMIYLDLMEAQVMAYNGVQGNNIDMMIKAWQTFLPMYFAFNNYARYGSYYTYILVNMEQFYPGLKELIPKEDLSVQGQKKYPLQTAIDQRGEQTVNRDAKTSGKTIFIARSLL